MCSYLNIYRYISESAYAHVRVRILSKYAPILLQTCTCRIVLRCVAVCCSVLQCVVVSRSPTHSNKTSHLNVAMIQCARDASAPRGAGVRRHALCAPRPEPLQIPPRKTLHACRCAHLARLWYGHIHMYILMYTCMHIHIHEYMYIHIYVHIHIYIYVYIYIDTDINIHVPKSIYIYICKYLYVYMYVYIYMHICSCVYIFIYICVCTYLHIHIQL